MNIVVCVKYVPDATGRPHASNSATTPPTASGSTGCCPSSTSTPSRRPCKIAEAARRGRGHRAHRRPRRRPPTPSARRCRWAPTRASTSSTTRSTAPTPSATSLVLAKAIKKHRGRRPRPLRHGLDRRRHGRRPGDARRAARAARRSRYASEVTVDGGTVTHPARRRRGNRDHRGDAAGGGHVTDQINEPRYPSFKGIMAAKKKPVETWRWPTSASTPREVGLDAAWTAVDRLRGAPAARAGPDRHRRGRRRRQARGVPRRPEVHLTAADD